MSYPSNPAGPDDRGYEPGGLPVPMGDLPPRPPTPGTRIGRVSGAELRQELRPGTDSSAYSLTVLAFRLLEPGNPQPLDVQLRGRSLSGTVRDGDWVEVAGPPDAMGRWDVAKVANLTTGSTVIMMGGRRSKAAAVVAIVVFSVIALVVVLIGVAVVVGLASS
jgi:hypothetical protein